MIIILIASFAMFIWLYSPIIETVFPYIETEQPLYSSIALLVFPLVPISLDFITFIFLSLKPVNSIISKISSSFKSLKAFSGEKPLPIAFTIFFA